MRQRRRLFVTILAALTVSLTACAGLPTSGPVTVGLPVGGGEAAPDITELAAGPADGAGPEEIVEGFLDAGITSADGWAIARQFLSPELAATWRPNAGVTIDTSATGREFTSGAGEDAEDAKEDEVRVQLNQVARVDDVGAYTELSGDAAVAMFELARDKDGEWRITAAENGIVLDEDTFEQVFRKYALQYFDQTWTHLVPDVRWYPWRETTATSLTQALLGGGASEWLAPAVRSAFPNGVNLARGAVPVNASVAEVELDSDALGVDAATLARMRTQLEQTLSGVGVTEVRFTVNARDLNAGRATVETGETDTGSIVLTADAFGYLVGDEMTELPGISPDVLELGPTVTAVDLAVDNDRAAMQLTSGVVYTVSAGGVDELDSRPGLIRPSMDPFGYTWSVPASSPAALIAWRSDVTPLNIANAFPDASAISQVRVAPDGARLAAVITVGSQRWVAVAAIIRDDDSAPTQLGEVHLVAQLPGTGLGLSWLGQDTLGVLVDDDGSRVLLTQIVAGPGTVSAAVTDAVSIAGAGTVTGVRLLDASGVVFAQRGTTWQQSLAGVLVLGTHAGQ